MTLFLPRSLRLFLLLALACTGACAAPKNIIIMFADGTAPTQWEVARYASRVLRDRSLVVTDRVFRDGTLGLLSTYPAGVFVTDSAAGASALSTGFKVLNGTVSITPEGGRPRTAMESAKQAGKRIGLVTTSQIYDASPAAFSVHAQSRREAQTIVDQYLALEPDVLLGGGRDFFLPQAAGGKRNDGKDVLAAFASKGYAILRDPQALSESGARKLIGLFSEKELELEIDRNPEREPAVADMTRAALKALERTTRSDTGSTDDKGFVLFVENENTDESGHKNDIAALIRALWAFDEAVAVALEFQSRNPDTLVIVAADHETGGLSATYARRELPGDSGLIIVGPKEFEKVMRIDASLDSVANRLGARPSPELLDALVAKHFPGFTLDSDLRDALLQQRPLERNFAYTTQNTLARMISRQTGFYWGTSGHTAEPVAIGAVGPGAEVFRGYADNTEFGRKLLSLIDGR